MTLRYRVPRPPATKPAPTSTLVRHVCTAADQHPHGLDAEYQHHGARDETLWAAWVAIHTPHGFQEATDG